MTRLAEIESAIASMGGFQDIVGAMRSLASMRVQEAHRTLPGIRRYAQTMADAIGAAQLLAPQVGDDRERPPPVGRAAGPGHQPGGLHPVDQAAHPALGHQHRVQQPLQPDGPLGGTVENQQHLVPGQRQPLRLHQLALEVAGEARLGAQEGAPGLQVD